MKQSGIYCICLGVLLFLFGLSAWAQNPQQVVKKYLDQLATAITQLEDGSKLSRKSIDIRNWQLSGAGYWHNVKKRSGIAIGPVSFFLRHKPRQWKIVSTEATSAKKVSVAVSLKLSSYPKRLWKTRFDMVQLDNKWLIENFIDITRRPVAENASVETILDTYLSEVKTVVARRLTGKLTKKETEAINMNYLFGAGYWLGHVSSKDVPAGKAYLFLSNWKPDSWKIAKVKVSGDHGEAKVVFLRKNKKGKQSEANVVFEFSRLSNGWFLADYHPDKNIQMPVQEKPVEVLRSSIHYDQSTPEALLQTQFAIIEKLTLVQTDNMMNKLADFSKSLWLDTPSAKRGMGRVLGMSVAFISRKQKLNWQITAKQQLTDTMKTIVATPGVPVLKMYKEIQFTVKRIKDKWFFADAIMQR